VQLLLAGESGYLTTVDGDQPEEWVAVRNLRGNEPMRRVIREMVKRMESSCIRLL
jgi:hypothetical protein